MLSIFLGAAINDMASKYGPSRSNLSMAGLIMTAVESKSTAGESETLAIIGVCTLMNCELNTPLPFFFDSATSPLFCPAGTLRLFSSQQRSVQEQKPGPAACKCNTAAADGESALHMVRVAHPTTAGEAGQPRWPWMQGREQRREGKHEAKARPGRGRLSEAPQRLLVARRPGGAGRLSGGGSMRGPWGRRLIWPRQVEQKLKEGSGEVEAAGSLRHTTKMASSGAAALAGMEAAR